MRNALIVGLLTAAVLGFASAAMAVPYASGVVQSGASSSFVLNEDGAQVQIVYDGGATVVDLGTQNKGTITFDATLGSSFQIKVSKSAVEGWTQISPQQTSTSFYVPVGVSVNRNPGSQNFGSVYVSNAVTGNTAYGRLNNLEGIYRLKGDMSEVNSGTAGVTWGGTSGPWKSAIGTDDRLYVSDLSNDLVYDVAPDLSGNVQLITAANRTANQWVAAVQVTGTQAAGNRKIFLINSNYGDTARKGVIEYSLGGNATVAADDTGSQLIGPAYFAYYPQDAVRDSSGNWYTGQYRSDPLQASALAKFLAGDLPGNTAAWEIPKAAPYNGSYAIDIYEEKGWVAYGNYYDGFVHIFNMADGSYVGGFDAGTRMRDIAFDAAGNLYTVDNMTEWLRAWSPGGNYTAITGSDGTFVLIPEPAAIVLLVLGGLVCVRRRRVA